MPGRERVCVHVCACEFHVRVPARVHVPVCVLAAKLCVLGSGERGGGRSLRLRRLAAWGQRGQEQGALLMGDSPDSGLGQRVGDGRRWAHLDLSTALFSL